MTLLEGLKKIVRKESPPIDIWHYFIGNYRYKLYYSSCKKAYCAKPKKHKLMRQHIWEQIAYRIQKMNRDCFRNGQCIKCGCDTTQLQMANKPCEGLEYPPMMNNKHWKEFLKGNYQPKYKEYIWVYLPLHKTTQLLKETNTGYVPVNNN